MALRKCSLGLCQELVGTSKAQDLQRWLNKTEAVGSVCSLLFLLNIQEICGLCHQYIHKPVYFF